MEIKLYFWGVSLLAVARYGLGLVLVYWIIGQPGAGNADPFQGLSNGLWIPATDTTKVQSSGSWHRTAFRYGAAAHLLTQDEGAALDVGFSGTGLVLRLGGHAVPSYGSPNLGILEVRIDGSVMPPIHLRETPREIALARNLEPGKHQVQLRHTPSAEGARCRIEGLYALEGETGELAFGCTGRKMPI